MGQMIFLSSNFCSPKIIILDDIGRLSYWACRYWINVQFDGNKVAHSTSNPHHSKYSLPEWWKHRQLIIILNDTWLWFSFHEFFYFSFSKIFYFFFHSYFQLMSECVHEMTFPRIYFYYSSRLMEIKMDYFLIFMADWCTWGKF